MHLAVDVKMFSPVSSVKNVTDILRCVFSSSQVSFLVLIKEGEIRYVTGFVRSQEWAP